ncbi:MAG: hypothetical protein APR62_08220 [Smithella sp. SDB]|nr:MAG: hypothetical protein APR62_08220 [Smithella sp. SDB]
MPSRIIVINPFSINSGLKKSIRKLVMGSMEPIIFVGTGFCDKQRYITYSPPLVTMQYNAVSISESPLDYAAKISTGKMRKA